MRNSRNILLKLNPLVYIGIAILLLLVLKLYPMIMVLIYSMFDNVIINPNPEFVGLQNFFEILSDTGFWNSLGNTLFFTFFSVFFHVLIGLGFALLLNTNINSKTRAFFRVVLVLPWIFTATVVAVVWRLILDPLGVFNYFLEIVNSAKVIITWFGSSDYAIYALTFVNIWAGYPFIMVSILAGLQGVSYDLYEAAKIDGANRIQQFFAVTLPHLKPIVLSIGLLDFIWTFQAFPIVWMTTGGGPGTSTEVLATYAYKQAFGQYQYSLSSTSSVLILFLAMILAYFYVKNQKRAD